MTKAAKRVVTFKEPALFEVCVGYADSLLDDRDHMTVEHHHFHVLAASFEAATRAVLNHFNAKTSDDLPKPFSMTRVRIDTQKVLVIL